MPLCEAFFLAFLSIAGVLSIAGIYSTAVDVIRILRKRKLKF